MSYSPLMKWCYGQFTPPRLSPQIKSQRSPITSPLRVSDTSPIDFEEIAVESPATAEDQKEKKFLSDYLISYQQRLQQREEFALTRPVKMGRVIYVKPKDVFLAAREGPLALEKFFNRGEEGFVMVQKPRLGPPSPILLRALKRNMILESLKVLIRYTDKKKSFVNRGNGTSPLRVALERRRTEIIPFLLYHGAVIESGLLSEDNKDSAQDLFFNAVEAGDLKLVKFFHLCGFPLNSTNEDENFNTALHLAAAANHPVIVSYLIRQGIDRTAKNQNEHDYLQYAESEFEKNFLEIVDFLLKEKSLAHFEIGSTKYLCALMNVKDVNRKIDDQGNTLLHILMKKGFMNCELRALCVHLIERGADPSQINSERKTPVDLASECIQKEKSSDVVEIENLLVEIRHSLNSPDETPEEKNSRAFTNVQKWIETKTPHLILDSIKKLTHPNQSIDGDGNTLLHSLVISLFDPKKLSSVSSFRILQVMTELVKQGASPSMINHEGVSALDLGRDLLSNTRSKVMYMINCQLIECLEELERSQTKAIGSPPVIECFEELVSSQSIAFEKLQVSKIVFGDSI